MQKHPPVFHPSSSDKQHVEQARESVRKSLEVLKQSKQSDNFLGRKTHEPFELPNEDEFDIKVC